MKKNNGNQWANEFQSDVELRERSSTNSPTATINLQRSNDKGHGTFSREAQSLKTATSNMQSYEVISENIQKFFKYNAQNLVRPAVKVDDLEQKKARTWVFFLVIVQLIVCVVYGFLLLQLPRSIIWWILAACLIFYYVLKLLLFVIFNLKRLFTCQCKLADYDPESADYEEVFIGVPIYNESKANLERTVSSITNSNYTKHKLYVIFIVDSNKGSSFQNLMEVLEGTKYEEKVPANARLIKHGVCNGVNYSVFLKDGNRGKRDSQWLLIELVRNIFPEHKPPYIVFLDSDTTFEPNALRFMVDTLKSDQSIAGVCGRVRISNYGWDCFSSLAASTQGGNCDSWDNVVFRFSTLIIIGMQFYEYTWNTFFGKHVESSTSAVTSLNSQFAMYRTDIVLNVDATVEQRSAASQFSASKIFNSNSTEKRSNMSFFYVTNVKQALPLVTEDFFSKPLNGLVERNIYDMSSERTLSIKFLELGYKCVYDPRVICYTEAPDSIAKLLHQRRRWNNTEFITKAVMLSRFKLWFQFKTFPMQILALCDLISSYLLLSHAVIIVYAIWTPFIKQQITTIDSGIIIFAWVLVQIIVISATKLDNADMFYVLNTFITGLMMAISIYFFIDETFAYVVDNISDDWRRAVVFFIYPVLHIIVSIFSPLSFISAIGSYLMFPTMSITCTLYSFFHLDEFIWSSR